VLGRFGVWVRANPLKLFSVVLILAVVSGVAVYAYLGLLTPQAGPRVIITSPPIDFSMELDKAEYKYGKNITIVLSLRNISNQTITMHKRSRWPYWRGHPVGPVVFTEFYGVSPEDENEARGLIHFGFSITHQNGTVIFRQYEGPLAATYDIDIYTGGYIKQTWIWDLPLPKATYQIRGILSCDVPGAFQHSTLETPSITFIVE